MTRLDKNQPLSSSDSPPPPPPRPRLSDDGASDDVRTLRRPAWRSLVPVNRDRAGFWSSCLLSTDSQRISVMDGRGHVTARR